MLQKKAVADALGISIEQLRYPPSNEILEEKAVKIEKEFLITNDLDDLRYRIMQITFNLDKEELKQVLGYLEGMKETRIKKTGA